MDRVTLLARSLRAGLVLQKAAPLGIAVIGVPHAIRGVITCRPPEYPAMKCVPTGRQRCANQPLQPTGRSGRATPRIVWPRET